MGSSGTSLPLTQWQITWEILKGRLGQEKDAVGTHRKTTFPAPPKGPLLLELALGVLESDVELIQLPVKL